MEGETNARTRRAVECVTLANLPGMIGTPTVRRRAQASMKPKTQSLSFVNGYAIPRDSDGEVDVFDANAFADEPAASPSVAPVLPQKPLARTTKPLWGLAHAPANDAVMGLAFGYGAKAYRVFVGSLRKAGFAGDVVLATSEAAKMRPGVEAYLRSQRVLGDARVVEA